MRDPIMLSTLLGEETRRSGTWKLYIFGMHFPSSAGRTREASLNVQAKSDATPGIVQVRKDAFSRSGPNRKAELGHWSAITYGVEEGAILKVYGYRSAPVRGQRAFIANQLIRMRRAAAVNRMQLPLSNAEGATHSEAFLYGRFDVLTVEQAEGYGLAMDARKKASFRSTHNSMLTLEEIEPGIELQEVFEEKVVVTDDGEEKRIVTGRRRRIVE